MIRAGELVLVALTACTLAPCTVRAEGRSGPADRHAVPVEVGKTEPVRRPAELAGPGQCASLLVVPEVRAAPGKGVPKAQIAQLEAYIAKAEPRKSESGQVFHAYCKLAEIYEARRERPAARKTYLRIVKAFNDGGFPKDGAIQSSAAAMAAFMLILPRYDAFMAASLPNLKQLPRLQHRTAMVRQVGKMLDLLLGPERSIKTESGEGVIRCGNCGGSAACRSLACGGDPKSNGLYDEYLSSVARYGSRDWSYAAMLHRARLLSHAHEEIYGTPIAMDSSEEEQDDRSCIGPERRTLRSMAIASLEAALQDATASGVDNIWVPQLRREMHKYKPTEYPLVPTERNSGGP